MLRTLPVLGAIALAGSACASAKSTGGQPSWRAGARAKATVPQRIVFAPSSVAVEHYNDPAVRPVPPSPMGDAIIAKIHSLSAELGKAAPAADGRLFAAASDLAAVTPKYGTVAYRLVEFALHRHGIIEPSPHLVVIRGPAADPATVVDQLSLRLVTILAESDFARVGVGVAERGPGDHVVVLALQSSYIKTRPIPRALPRGGQVPVVGNIAARYSEPHIYVTRETGEVESPALFVGTDGGFATEIDCGEISGRQQVEITASDETGSTVLANFPIFCRAEPPASITVEYSRDDAEISASPGAAEARMVELINRDRERHGLSPVAIDERVTAVARAHSQDMLETGIVGHISPNTGSASDRVEAAGINSALVLENVARAYGLTEAQDGLMNSPGHRANILAPKATHVGVGIVLGKEVAGRREMFITQVFIRVTGKIDREAVIGQVSERIRSARPVAADAWLAEVAQDMAGQLASGVETQKAAAQASEKLRSRPNDYRGVTTVATTVADVASFDPRQALADKSISHFGVGVAQGDHPELGDGAIFIVVLLGHK